jgi:hypothetical protein
MSIDDYYLIVPRGLTAFLIHVALGGACFLIASGLAWFLPDVSALRVPQRFYFLRLLFMLVLVLFWWTFDFHRHYNGHPSGWGIEVGNRYGMHTIWAWLVLALIGRPKKKKQESSAA